MEAQLSADGEANTSLLSNFKPQCSRSVYDLDFANTSLLSNFKPQCSRSVHDLDFASYVMYDNVMYDNIMHWLEVESNEVQP